MGGGWWADRWVDEWLIMAVLSVWWEVGGWWCRWVLHCGWVVDGKWDSETLSKLSERGCLTCFFWRHSRQTERTSPWCQRLWPRRQTEVLTAAHVTPHPEAGSIWWRYGHISNESWLQEKYFRVKRINDHYHGLLMSLMTLTFLCPFDSNYIICLVPP